MRFPSMFRMISPVFIFLSLAPLSSSAEIFPAFHEPKMPCLLALADSQKSAPLGSEDGDDAVEAPGNSADASSQPVSKTSEEIYKETDRKFKANYYYSTSQLAAQAG